MAIKITRRSAALAVMGLFILVLAGSWWQESASATITRMDLYQLSTFIQLDSGESFTPRKRNIVIVLPASGCPHCENFLRVLKQSAGHDTLDVFLPALTPSERNELLVSSRFGSGRLQIFLPGPETAKGSLFLHGALFMHMANGRVQKLRRITKSIHFTRANVDRMIEAVSRDR